MTPIAKIKFKIAGYPIANPNPNKRAPISKEKIVNRTINRFIYFCKGVSYCKSFALAAKLAICPIKVRSPVPNTTPIPVPSFTNVEKKAIFLV
jgi:hypothetical protein